MANGLLHGADYNYEQWIDRPDIQAEDFRLMKQARCNVMTVGVFAWSMLEPEEGQFQFDWLDRLMDSLAKNEMRAILATPSGARPVWMSQRYPETRRVNEQGWREPHRYRHNHCRTSPIYREKCGIINTKLAERYATHPALLLWHVSNEYDGQPCHCNLCYSAFRTWLKARYGSLEAINQAWWTTFWSHRYTEWEQIEPVDDSIHGLMIDWQRFISQQTLDFFLTECQPLRTITPQIPITTNFMRPNVGLDYWEFAPYIDVISWDNYPLWHSGDDVKIGLEAAFHHDLHRSYKQGQPFLLMESTPSITNWPGISRPKQPGVNILSSLQAVAHGADSVQYFQWRQSRGSGEKFHGAVVSHGGANNRLFREVAEIGEILTQIQEIKGTSVQPEVALIYDQQNEWALNQAQLARRKDKNYVQTCMSHYGPFWKRGIAVDVIDSTADLSRYKLVIAPMLYMLRGDTAERLQQYVQNGGTLVATYLTGLVNDTDLCFLADPPGPLQAVFGLRCEEQDVLHDGQTGQIIALDNNGYGLTGEYTTIHYADVVQTEGAQALAIYNSEFYQGQPALTVHSYGAGKAYYIAARSDPRLLMDFYRGLSSALGLKPALHCDLPEGVTAQVRRSEAAEFVFLLNFTPEPREVQLDSTEQFIDLKHKNNPMQQIKLAGYGVSILKRISAP